MKHFLLLLIVGLFTANVTVQAQTVTVSTLAGSDIAGSTDGTGTAASFNNPTDVAVDGGGNVYVVDNGNQKIRKITPEGVVTTFAGSGTIGSTNGTGVAASFRYPRGIAVDGSGNVYVADQSNHKIRMITSAGVVSTLAGNGTQGSTDGAAGSASFNNPSALAVDGSGNVYVADSYNAKVRKISSGMVTTLASSGFVYPDGLAVGADGNIYMADAVTHKIYKITTAGVVTTFAGSGTAGSTDGTGTAASFKAPAGLAFDAGGNLYVADNSNQKIRKITSAGVVTTYAGAGTQGRLDGVGTVATFKQPQGVAIAGGNLYVADYANGKIRKIIETVLPVNLLSYTAKADGNYAKLQWQTASEVNNKGFEIWRKVEGGGQEGRGFVKIGEVSALATRNTQPVTQYNYTDYAPLNGNNYYKLIQIDNDGKATELGVKTVNLQLSTFNFQLYPNPATHSITLNLGNKKGTLTISDALGRAKTTLGYHASPLTIDISAYPSGLYFYQLGNVKGKFIKQ